MAIEITDTPARPAAAGPRLAALGTPRRVSVRERMFFTERLALLLDSGVPLHTALGTLAEQAQTAALRAAVAALREDVVQGKQFSQALASRPETFPASYVNLVAAAEGGGFLPAVLRQLIDLDEKAERVRSTLASALAYPAFLSAFSVLILFMVLVFVFPRFSGLFAGLGDRLPGTTAFLLAASTLLREDWHWLSAALAAAVLGVAHALRQPPVRALAERFVIGAPVLGTLAVELYLMRCLHVLALSLANGVSVMSALAASREVVANGVFRAFIEDLERRVGEGQPLASGFEATGFVPPLVRQMVATGEQSGHLGKVLRNLADHYQRDIERRIGLLARLAEPLMLALMGGLVGLVVSALLLPVFRLSAAIH